MVVRIADRDDGLLPVVGAILDRMAADVDRDHEARNRWSRTLCRMVLEEPGFAESRLGMDVLDVAALYASPSWDNQPG